MTIRRVRYECLLMTFVLALSFLPSRGHALEWHEVAAELMSPACPGRTLINCTSEQAEQWRKLVRQKVAQGESKEQILRHFVEIGGEEVLASPPKRGFTLTVWLLPVFILINGAWLILVLTRRWARRRTSQAETVAVKAVTVPQDEAAPDPYLQRLRRELEEFNR